MAITTYSELKAAIPEWAERNDFSDAELSEFVALAEARLNRKLKEVEATASLTGTVDSRTIDISALPFISPIALKIVEISGNEREVPLRPLGDINYYDGTRCPKWYEINGTNIAFDALLDQAYAFRFPYVARFALSDAAPTNKLLTENPDIYLAAVLVWSGVKVSNERLGMWKGILEEGIPEVMHILAEQKRTVLTPDPMFSATSRRSLDNWRT